MKKHCAAKFLQAIWDISLHENYCSYNSCRFSCKFAFVLFLSFLTNQKQEPGFHQVGRLVTRNIYFLFIAGRALLQSHTKLDRRLQKNFLTFYSCWYYISITNPIHFMVAHFDNIWASCLNFLYWFFLTS